jgi:hypothetical protein
MSFFDHFWLEMVGYEDSRGDHQKIVEYSLSAFGAYLNKRIESLEAKTEESPFFSFSSFFV